MDPTEVPGSECGVCQFPRAGARCGVKGEVTGSRVWPKGRDPVTDKARIRAEPR